MEETKNRLTAFFCADVVVMIAYLGGLEVYSEAWHFVIKIAATALLGVVGGLFGLVGKDLYPIIKKWIKDKLK